jgi:hypothetical protein
LFELLFSPWVSYTNLNFYFYFCQFSGWIRHHLPYTKGRRNKSNILPGDQACLLQNSSCPIHWW